MTQPPAWQPTDLDEVTARLGEPLAAYRSDRSRLIPATVGSLAIAAAGAVVAIGELAGPDPASPLVEAGGGICLCGLVMLRRFHRFCGRQVLAYPAAIIFLRGRRVSVLFWDELAEIRPARDKDGSVTVSRRDGERFTYVCDYLRGGKELTRWLRGEAERRAIPWAAPDSPRPALAGRGGPRAQWPV